MTLDTTERPVLWMASVLSPTLTLTLHGDRILDRISSVSYPSILKKSNIIATVISSFLNGKVCPNNTTFKSTIRLCDYFRVYSSCLRSQHMHRAPSLHILENITKRSSHIRGTEKMVGYRLSYLITCMCFVNMR
jgi:hypothetical protein